LIVFNQGPEGAETRALGGAKDMRTIAYAILAAFLAAMGPAFAGSDQTGLSLPDKFMQAGGQWDCISQTDYNAHIAKGESFIKCKWTSGDPRIYIIVKAPNLDIRVVARQYVQDDAARYAGFGLHDTSPATLVNNRHILNGRYQDIVFEYSWLYNGPANPGDLCKGPDCKKQIRMDMIPVEDEGQQYLILILTDVTGLHSSVPMAEADKAIEHLVSQHLG
jgi:hypothetical protein